MTKTVDFIFDCASPNAYLVYRPLRELVLRKGAELNIIPCLLGGIFKATNNQPPMVSNAGIENKSAYERLEFVRFIKAHGLSKFQFNEHFPVNTLLAMRGAVHAKQTGELEPYIECMLHHMWEQPKKLDEKDIYVAALDECGLNGNAYVVASQRDMVKAELINNTATAVKRGAFGVPIFFVGDEMFFGKERLGQIEALLEQPS